MSKLSRRLRRLTRSTGLDIRPEDAQRVAICTPAGDMVHTVYSISLLQMALHTLQSAPPRLANFSLQTYGGSLLPHSRNQITNSALDWGATHLLWIDSDMEFDPDLMIRLLAHDLPIVGANCVTRRPPFDNTARTESGHQITTSLHSSGLEKVDRTGFGVILIAAEVFRAIEKPYFDFVYLPEKDCFVGEDYYLLCKAKEAGYEVYVDHDVSKAVKHIGTFGYSPVLKAMGESLTEKTND